MKSRFLAVRLKAPDPSAATALCTLSRVLPDCSPERLARYDLWEFLMKSGDLETVKEMVTHFTDIVNPNKHLSFILPMGSPPPGEEPGLSWTGVLVRNHRDSVSENWSRLLPRRGFPVAGVRYGVLWRFGYPMKTGNPEKLAMKASLSLRRELGLLANPVSQEALPWNC